MATATVDLLQPRAKSCGAELLLETATDIPPLVAGADALEHILTNLIMNALDAVNCLEKKDGRGGEVRVVIAAGKRFAEITVADNGTGILPEHLNRVFDPFFTTKEAGKGTGLGLSVIYSLIRDLGGDIEVENRPGGGALFRVYLPLAAKENQ
jgi:signal transduction histidine kinase